MDLRCKGAAALKLFTEAPSSGRPDVMWTEGFPVCVCRGGVYEITTASFNAKISRYMYKKKSIYVNTFYCIIIILYMHISQWI